MTNRTETNGVVNDSVLTRNKVSSLNEITKKILQCAISLIVRHEPHAHARPVRLRFSDETFLRNCVRSVHANAAET